MSNSKLTTRNSQLISWGSEVLKKEIGALQKACAALGKDFENAVKAIKSCRGKVVITGLGKSGHIGRKAAATFSSLGIPAVLLHSAEALHGDIGIVQKGDVMVAISHSGKALEILQIIDATKKLKVPVIAITGNPVSPLASCSTIVLNTGVTSEADHLNLAPTASSTVTLTLLDALAVAVARSRGFTTADFAKLHPAGALGKKARKKGGE
ncbi:MAG: SIS domain-containing protein [bacterium]